MSRTSGQTSQRHYGRHRLAVPLPSCTGGVSGVLQGFGTGSPDPTLGGPELDGGFVAPVCPPPPLGPPDP